MLVRAQPFQVARNKALSSDNTVARFKSACVTAGPEFDPRKHRSEKTVNTFKHEVKQADKENIANVEECSSRLDRIQKQVSAVVQSVPCDNAAPEVNVTNTVGPSSSSSRMIEPEENHVQNRIVHTALSLTSESFNQNSLEGTVLC
jgi:hypothetical protein